jgi:hypothetical protein
MPGLSLALSGNAAVPGGLLAIVIATGLLSAVVRKRAERQLKRLDDLDSSAT